MDVPANMKRDFVEAIRTHLGAGKYKDALSISQDKSNANAVKENSCELIPLILNQIDDETIVVKPSLQHCCEELLHEVADRSNPEEVLLELIEQAEVAQNDARFLVVLRPLNNILLKLTIKRGRSLEWCLNTISSYVTALPKPFNVGLDGKERLLMDSDTNVRRIVKIYSQLPRFYEDFISEVQKEVKFKSLSQTLAAFLIDLLGEPFIFIDIEWDGKTKSEARICAEMLLKHICVLEKNILYFLSYSEFKCKVNNKARSNSDGVFEDSPNDIFLLSDKLKPASLGGLFYLALAEETNMPHYALPQVYSAEYVLHSALLPAILLLNYTEFSPISKGLKLTKALLQKISAPASDTLLDAPVHVKLCRQLSNIAVFSVYESLRKKSVNIISYYVNKFNWKGRVILIRCFIEVANHSGLIGYAITLFKDLMNEILNSNQVLPDEFCGPRLLHMLKLICNLPHGAESDLMELADQIIAALNILRFLALKDVANRTNIHNHFKVLQKIYIEPLRSGLNMSKAHYEVKLKDIKEGKHFSKDDVKIDLTVAGSVLDKIPLEGKENLVNSALNAFCLIEGLMVRVVECFEASKL